MSAQKTNPKEFSVYLLLLKSFEIDALCNNCVKPRNSLNLDYTW